MAEVISDVGGSVNFQGLSAATPQIVPSEGRTSVARSQIVDSIGDVASLFETIRSNSNKAKEKADFNALTNRAAIQTESDQLEATLNPGAFVENLLSQSEAAGRLPVSDKAKAGLVALNAEQQRLGALFKQIPEKDRERRKDAALRLSRIRFLTEFPEHGVEALVASGKIDKIPEAASEFDNEKEAKAREEDQRKKLTTYYEGALGRVVDPATSTEDLARDYATNYEPKRREYLANAQALAALNDNEKITDSQKRIARDTLLEKVTPGNYQGAAEFTTNLVKSAQAGGDPTALLQSLDNYTFQLRNQINVQEGFTDPAEVDKKYGSLFAQLTQAGELIKNKRPLEQLETNNRIFTAAAESIVNSTLGANVVQLKLLGPLAPYIGPALAQTVLARAKVGQPETLADRTINGFVQVAAFDSALKSGNAPDIYKAVADYSAKQNQTPGYLRDGEKGVAELVKGALSGIDKVDGVARQGVVNLVKSTLSSEYSAKSATAWGDAIDLLDSPDYDKYLKAAGKDTTVDGIAVRNTRRYILALAGEAQKRVPEGVTPAYQWDGKAQELTVDPASIQSLAPGVRDGYINSVRRLSKGLRVLRTRFGQRSDDETPGRLLQEIEARGE